MHFRFSNSQFIDISPSSDSEIIEKSMQIRVVFDVLLSEGGWMFIMSMKGQLDCTPTDSQFAH